MEKFENLRPVGRLERYSTARHALKFYLGPSVTASYTLPGTCTQPLKDYVYEALGDVIAEHSILSVIPVDEHTQDPYFVRLPEIHLDSCVTFLGRRDDVTTTDIYRDVEQDELLSDQHSISYSAPDPFWRVCVLTSTTQPHDFTAAFFYHHALGDGNSGLAFHRTFHRALSRAVSNPRAASSVSVIPSSSNPILPSVESLHPLPTTIWHLVKVLFQEKVWSSRDPGLWTGGKCTVPLGQSRVRHFAFSPSTTTAFKNLCRENSTTITAALHTLMAGTIFGNLSSNYTALKISGAISTRRFLPTSAGITDDSMGVWIQDLSDTYSRKDFQEHDATHCILPWSEAQRSHRTIDTALSLNGTNTAVGLLKYVNNYQEELFLSKVGNDRNSSCEVSNLGLFKLPAALTANGEEENAVKIGRMVFTQSAGVTSAAMQVCVVTGMDGCLVLGVSWQEGIVEDQLVGRIMDSVEAEIKRLTGTA